VGIPASPPTAVAAAAPVEEEAAHEEVAVTPLIKFVGQKLADKSLTHLEALRSGFFKYHLLSVASRGEWVAAKVIQAFDEAGYTENSLYDMAALKGKQGFKDYLTEAVASEKVAFGGSKLTAQESKLVSCVVGLIVKYFTFDGSADSDDNVDIDLDDGPGDGAGVAAAERPVAQERSILQTFFGRKRFGLIFMLNFWTNSTKKMIY
jgi:hypothetical protein